MTQSKVEIERPKTALCKTYLSEKLRQPDRNTSSPGAFAILLQDGGNGFFRVIQIVGDGDPIIYASLDPSPMVETK